MKPTLLLLCLCAVIQAADLNESADNVLESNEARVQREVDSAIVSGSRRDINKATKSILSLSTDLTYDQMDQKEYKGFVFEAPVHMEVDFDPRTKQQLAYALEVAKQLYRTACRVPVTLEGHHYIGLMDMTMIDQLIKMNFMDLDLEAMKSAVAGNFTLVRHFIQNGADINNRKLGNQVGSILRQGIIKKERCDISCVKWLVDHGAELKYEGYPGGYIQLALMMQRPDVARYLISKKAEEPEIWSVLLESGQLDLFANALYYKYPITIKQREMVVKRLIENKKFLTAHYFLHFEVTLAEEKDIEELIEGSMLSISSVLDSEPNLACPELEKLANKIDAMKTNLEQLRAEQELKKKRGRNVWRDFWNAFSGGQPFEE